MLEVTLPSGRKIEISEVDGETVAVGVSIRFREPLGLVNLEIVRDGETEEVSTYLNLRRLEVLQ